MILISGRWSVVGKGEFCLALYAMLFALCSSSEAQQPTKNPRIGFINASSPSAILARYEAFRQGLRELGYVEGKNIIIEYRYAEGKLDRLRDIMAELVRLKVDLIVTAGPSATRAAKEATSIIPIVMALDYDPIGHGFVPRISFFTLPALLFVLCAPAAAQHSKLHRVGLVSLGSSVTAEITGLRDGLKEAGYVEGKILSWTSGSRSPTTTFAPLFNPTWRRSLTSS